MHIASTSHEQATTAHVYTYEGDYEIVDSEIRWNAQISHNDDTQRFSGAIKLNSPAVATLAEQVVRDEIVKHIDTFEEKGNGADYRSDS